MVGLRTFDPDTIDTASMEDAFANLAYRSAKPEARGLYVGIIDW